MEPQNPAPIKSFGVVMGGVIALAVLVFGGLYFWGKSIATSDLTSDDRPSFQVTSSVVTEKNLTDEEIDAIQQLDALPPMIEDAAQPQGSPASFK